MRNLLKENKNFKFFLKNVFCAFWALDIAPTLDVPVLFSFVAFALCVLFLFQELVLSSILSSPFTVPCCNLRLSNVNKFNNAE